MSPQSKEGQKQRRNEEIDWKIKKKMVVREYLLTILKKLRRERRQGVL
jgi:hypothetical protein